MQCYSLLLSLFLGMVFSTGQQSVLILFSRLPYMALPSSLFLGMILSNHRSSNKCNIVQIVLSIALDNDNMKNNRMQCIINNSELYC
jgi:ABC-type multidrug transport system permease subunit